MKWKINETDLSSDDRHLVVNDTVTSVVTLSSQQNLEGSRVSVSMMVRCEAVDNGGVETSKTSLIKNWTAIHLLNDYSKYFLKRNYQYRFTHSQPNGTTAVSI